MSSNATWTDPSETTTSEWQKNLSFYNDAKIYDDATLDYDAPAEFYDTYDPSSVDKNDDVIARASWSDTSGSGNASWSDV